MACLSSSDHILPPSTERPVTCYQCAHPLYITLICLAACLGFIVTAATISPDPAGPDRALLLQAAEMRHPIFTRLMLFITWLGDPLFLTGLLAVVGVWLLVRRWWSAVLYIVLAGGGVGVLNILIKQSYQRPRPNMVPMLLDPSGFSFPSGHTMGATGAYGALLVIGLYLLPRRRWQAALALLIGLLVLLIGSSRVYLGVHYPTDVLGGWLAGGAWLLLATHFTCLVVWIRLRYVIGMRFP